MIDLEKLNFRLITTKDYLRNPFKSLSVTTKSGDFVGCLRAYINTIDSLSDREEVVKKAEKEGIDKLFYLSVFQVERKYERQGIGRKMLCTLKEKLKNSILYLDASSYGDIPNEKLIEFYESMGFEIVKEGEGKERRFSTMLCINK